VLLSFGGQTALNLGLDLNDKGVFKRLGIRVLGTPVQSVKTTEDRELFKAAMEEIGTLTARSAAAYTVKEALAAAKSIGYPVMLRAGFSLGGLGSGRVDNDKGLESKVTQALKAAPQVLIEEFLTGWKEIEYEVVRKSPPITTCKLSSLPHCKKIV